MTKKAAVPFLLSLLLAMSACLVPVEARKGVFGADGGWQKVRVALKKAFAKKRPLTLMPPADPGDVQLGAADSPFPARSNLAGDAGFSFPFARTSGFNRTYTIDVAAAHTAFYLEGLRTPRTVCRQIAIQTVYRPLAVVMPNLRSPPPAVPEVS